MQRTLFYVRSRTDGIYIMSSYNGIFTCDPEDLVYHHTYAFVSERKAKDFMNFLYENDETFHYSDKLDLEVVKVTIVATVESINV